MTPSPDTVVPRAATRHTVNGPVHHGGARARTYWTLIFIMLSIGVGGAWDRAWHATHPFEGFFSPPHIFIYANAVIASFIVLSMILDPAIRRAFGYDIALPAVPFAIPGPLLLLGGAVVMIGIAGLVFDNLWHTTFGLDETLWSFPHAMLGWTFLLAALGIVACRLALRPYRPLHWYTTIGLGWLLAGFSRSPFLGPFEHTRSPVQNQIIAALPVLARNAAFQHVVRIIQTYDLARDNPLLLIFATLWMGAILAFLIELDGRWWIVLTTALIVTIGDSQRSEALKLSRLDPTILQHPVNWLPLPLIVGALVVVPFAHRRIPGWLVWGMAGLLFAAVTALEYRYTGAGWGFVLLAPVLAVGGAHAGRWAYRIVANPFPQGNVASLLAIGLLFPALSGIVDLALRLTTP